MNSLNDYDQYKVLRPLYGHHEFDENDFPILNLENFDYVDWNKVRLLNSKNISSKEATNYDILIQFNDDKVLESNWNNPLGKIVKMQKFLAVCTEDFSVYPNMNINDIRTNVYKSRWLGCTYQDYGIKVIPTISWGTEETYDICFSGIIKGSIVIISTLGCQNSQEIFLKGFNEMKKRISPSVIIVFGRMIKGMSGKFIQFNYEEAFNKKNNNCVQLQLFDLPAVFEIKEGI